MSLRTLAGVVLLLAVSVGLAATNPTMREYRAFLETQLEQAAARLDQGGQSGERDRQLLREQAKPLIAQLLASATVRRNAGVFSLFETKLLGLDITVLGIATKFIPIAGTDELEKKIHQLSSRPLP
jgi:hypothetical protein